MPALILSILLLADPTPTLPTPQWKVGQEYLYRGTVKETNLGQSIQLLNQYQLEVRVIVLSVSDTSAEVACCTKLVQQGVSKVEQALSVHLTRANINQRGKISSCTAPTGMALIIDGPATWESGFILPLPADTIQPGGTWEVAESSRLPRRFTWMPTEENSAHLNIKGVQQSVDWEHPRADTTGWRRTDKLTFTPKATLPTKVERTVERRAPAHQNVTGRIITEYELVKQEVLVGPIFDERRKDIQQIKLYQEEVAMLAGHPHDAQARIAWQRLATRLERYLSAPGHSPYREAITTLLSTVQAGMDNRLSVQQAKFETIEPSIPIGQLTPSFTLLTPTGQSVSSNQCRGKPCMIVFLQPGSELTRYLTVEIPAWQQRLGANTFGCLLLSSTDASNQLPTINEPKGALLKVANGRPLVASYGANVTPFFVVLDADGALLATHEGWGPEVRQQLEKKIKQELEKTRR
ncbi:MAG TPA: hypothetical protein PLN21_12365 [Gemmatales bacterium]|nr:hypothetical protein [Gemmatales bacterium]